LKLGTSGVIATAIDVATLIVLVEIASAHVTVAAFLAATAGGVVNFLLNKYWAFQDRTRIGLRQVSTYALVSLVTAMFVASSIHVLAVLVGLPYLLAKAIAAVLVFLFWSYPAQARIVFPAGASRDGSVVLRDLGDDEDEDDELDAALTMRLHR
jgi:putative flippase GtrA